MNGQVFICVIFISTLVLVSGQGGAGGAMSGLGATAGRGGRRAGGRGMGGLMGMAAMSGGMGDFMQDFLRCRMLARMGIPIQLCLMNN